QDHRLVVAPLVGGRPLEIDDVAAVDPEEALGVEPGLQLRNGKGTEIVGVGGEDPAVVLLRLDADDAVEIEQDRRLVADHRDLEQPVGRRLGRRLGGDGIGGGVWPPRPPGPAAGGRGGAGGGAAAGGGGGGRPVGATRGGG